MKIYESGSLSLLAFQFCTQLREPLQGQTCGPGYLSHPSFPTLHLRYQSPVTKEANSPPSLLRKGTGSDCKRPHHLSVWDERQWNHSVRGLGNRL